MPKFKTYLIEGSKEDKVKIQTQINMKNAGKIKNRPSKTARRMHRKSIRFGVAA